MATLNAIVADSGQNSYVTLAEANEYMNDRYSVSTWKDLSSNERSSVLIQAAKDLENFNYRDDKYYTRQGLQMPRDDHTVITGVCGTPVTTTTFRHSSLYSSTYMTIPDNRWKYGSCHITTGTAVRETRRITDSVASNGEITLATELSATPDGGTTFIVFAPIADEVKYAQCEQALHIIKNPDFETVINYRNSGAKRIDIDDVRLDFHEGSFPKMSISPESRRLISRWLRKRLRMARR